MTGAELIAQERQRQIEQEGWTAEHDEKQDLSQSEHWVADEFPPPMTHLQNSDVAPRITFAPTGMVGT